MGCLSKSLASVLILIVALSSACLVMVKPANAQTTPISTPTPIAGSAPYDSWTRVATMPSTNLDCKAAVVDGIIYVIGENASDYAYNPSTDTWTPIAPMPTSRVSFAVAACDNKIYVMGGYNRTSVLSYSLNEVYDPSNNTWSTAAPMPTSRGGMNAITVNGKIYVVGGGTATSTERVRANGTDIVDVTEIYNPATDSWSTGAPMPYAVDYYASAAVDNSIYVIGEYYPQNPPPVLFNQIYNTETNSWSLGSAFPGKAYMFIGGGATAGSNAPKRIYVFGGIMGYNYWPFSNQSYAYDPATGSWSSAAAWPDTNTTCHSLVAIDDLLYAITGDGEVWQYTPIGYQPTVATIWANADNGSNVELTANGNITSSQMSNIHISTNQAASTTNLSFTLTGQSGNVGFSNITIPKNYVPYGNISTVYIDNQPAQNQSCTQDTSNYYVWYMTDFSSHNVSVVFAIPSPAAHSVSDLYWLIIVPLLLSVFSVAVLLRHRKTASKQIAKP